MICLFVSAAMILTNHLPAGASESVRLGEPTVRAESLPPDLSQLRVPAAIGDIQEIYQGASKQTVLLIQDAHAVSEAQEHIADLIRHLNSRYGVHLVTAEGASGELRADLFRAFPDPGILREVFDGYQKGGYLSGVVEAAIFPETDKSREEPVFYGIEDWTLYEEGINRYLLASAENEDLLSQIASEHKALAEQKKRNYSPELLKVDGLLARFYDEKQSFLEVLTQLSAVMAPAPGSQLALLLEESTGAEKNDLRTERELRRLCEDFKVRLEQSRGDDAQRDLRELNVRLQSFQTGAEEPSAFALYLKELAGRYRWAVKVSSRVNALTRRAKGLRDIRGTKLFSDFENYVRELKGRLFRNDAEREIDRREGELRLLERTAKLELTVEDWDQLRKLDPRSKIQDASGEPNSFGTDSYLESGLSNLVSEFREHFAFYENAIRRDDALFENYKKLTASGMDAVIVAGGFHTQGLTRKFRESGISYAVFVPQIGQLPAETGYGTQMLGQVPWKDYFEIKDGRVGIYDAFVRGTRDRLLADSKNRMVPGAAGTGSGNLSRNVPGTVDAGTLKTWRDNVIRNLAAQNRTAEAGEDTKYLDELRSAAGGRNRWRETILETARRFVTGLKKLQASNQLTEQNIFRFLAAKTVTAWPTSPAGICPGSSIRFEAAVTAEMGFSQAREESRSEEKPEEVRHQIAQMRAVNARATLNRDGALLILRDSILADEEFEWFVMMMINSLPSTAIGDEVMTPPRFAEKIRAMYKVYQEFVRHPSDPAVVEVFNLSGESGAETGKSTSVILVTADTLDASETAATVFANRRYELVRQYPRTFIPSYEGKRKAAIMLFQVTQDGKSLASKEVRGIQYSLTGAVARTVGVTKEQIFAGQSNGSGIYKGRAAFLRGFSGGLYDVVYDIYGDMDPALTVGERERFVRNRRAKDGAEFERTISQIKNEMAALPAAFGLGPEDVNRGIHLVEILEKETLEKGQAIEKQEAAGVMPYRPSSLSIFLDLMKERRSLGIVSHLKADALDAIQGRLVRVVRGRFRLVTPQLDVQGQRGALESEVAAFDRATTEVLDRYRDKASLAGIIRRIELPGGLKDTIKEKIRSQSMTAVEAILEIIGPDVTEKKRSGDAKERENARDVEILFTNIYKRLRGQGEIKGEIISGQATGDLIIFARDMNPIDLIEKLEEFPGARMIVLDQGTLAAHSALVAMDDFGVPTVILPSGSLDRIMKEMNVNQEVVVNGLTGQVYLNPSEESRRQIEEQSDISLAVDQTAKQHAAEPAVTREGRQIYVRASTNTPTQVQDAMENGADDIGLVRTEFLLGGKLLQDYLSDPTQYEAALLDHLKSKFLEMLERAGEGATVIMRTYDLEPDKDLGLPNLNKLYGPAYYRTRMGLLLLKLELKAMLLADAESTKGRLKILFPMFRSPESLRESLRIRSFRTLRRRPELQEKLDRQAEGDLNLMNQVLNRVIDELAQDASHRAEAQKFRSVPRGFMIETVEGWHILPQILKYSDFINLGSSDFTVSLFRERGISRESVQDMRFFTNIQKEFLVALDDILGKINVYNNGPGKDSPVDFNLCGIMAGHDGILGFLDQVMPSGVRVGITRGAYEIPKTKQFVRAIHSDDFFPFVRMEAADFNLDEETERALRKIRARIIDSPEVQAALAAIVQKAKRANVVLEDETETPGGVVHLIRDPEKIREMAHREKGVRLADGRISKIRQYQMGPGGMHYRPGTALYELFLMVPALKARLRAPGKDLDLKNLQDVTAVIQRGVLVEIELTGTDEEVERGYKFVETLEEESGNYAGTHVFNRVMAIPLTGGEQPAESVSSEVKEETAPETPRQEVRSEGGETPADAALRLNLAQLIADLGKLQSLFLKTEEVLYLPSDEDNRPRLSNLLEKVISHLNQRQKEKARIGMVWLAENFSDIQSYADMPLMNGRLLAGIPREQVEDADAYLRATGQFRAQFDNLVQRIEVLPDSLPLLTEEDRIRPESREPEELTDEELSNRLVETVRNLQRQLDEYDPLPSSPDFEKQENAKAILSDYLEQILIDSRFSRSWELFEKIAGNSLITEYRAGLEDFAEKVQSETTGEGRFSETLAGFLTLADAMTERLGDQRNKFREMILLLKDDDHRKLPVTERFLVIGPGEKDLADDERLHAASVWADRLDKQRIRDAVVFGAGNDLGWILKMVPSELPRLRNILVVGAEDGDSFRTELDRALKYRGFSPSARMRTSQDVEERLPEGVLQITVAESPALQLQTARSRMEVRQAAPRSEYRTVVEVYDPAKNPIRLAVNPTPSGHLYVDINHQKFYWDGKEGNLSYAEGPITVTETGEKHTVNVPWGDFAAGIVAGDLYSYHNLYVNDWFCAFDGATRQLYHRAGEPFDERTYPMFVAWGDGTVSSEDLNFTAETEAISTQAPGRVKVYRASDTKRENDLSGSFRSAFSAQRIIHDGQNIPARDFAHMVSDAFQLRRFPQILIPKPDGTLGYGEKFGLREYGNRMAEVERDDGFITVDLSAYAPEDREKLESGALQLEVPGRPVYHRRNLDGLAEITANDLRTGEYDIRGNTLYVKMYTYPYPHNLMGITKSGKAVAIVFTGDKMKGIGVAFQELADAARREYAARVGTEQAQADPLEELFVLANSKDANRWKITDGKAEMTESSDKPYQSSTAALVIETPERKAPSVRSEMRMEGPEGPIDWETYGWPMPDEVRDFIRGFSAGRAESRRDLNFAAMFSRQLREMILEPLFGANVESLRMYYGGGAMIVELRDRAGNEIDSKTFAMEPADAAAFAMNLRNFTKSYDVPGSLDPIGRAAPERGYILFQDDSQVSSGLKGMITEGRDHIAPEELKQLLNRQKYYRLDVIASGHFKVSKEEIPASEYRTLLPDFRKNIDLFNYFNRQSVAQGLRELGFLPEAKVEGIYPLRDEAAVLELTKDYLMTALMELSSGQVYIRADEEGAERGKTLIKNTLEFLEFIVDQTGVDRSMLAGKFISLIALINGRLAQPGEGGKESEAYQLLRGCVDPDAFESVTGRQPGPRMQAWFDAMHSMRLDQWLAVHAQPYYGAMRGAGIQIDQTLWNEPVRVLGNVPAMKYPAVIQNLLAYDGPVQKLFNQPEFRTVRHQIDFYFVVSPTGRSEGVRFHIGQYDHSEIGIPERMFAEAQKDSALLTAAVVAAMADHLIKIAGWQFEERPVVYQGVPDGIDSDTLRKSSVYWFLRDQILRFKKLGLNEFIEDYTRRQMKDYAQIAEAFRQSGVPVLDRRAWMLTAVLASYLLLFEDNPGLYQTLSAELEGALGRERVQAAVGLLKTDPAISGLLAQPGVPEMRKIVEQFIVPVYKFAARQESRIEIDQTLWGRPLVIEGDLVKADPGGRGIRAIFGIDSPVQKILSLPEFESMRDRIAFESGNTLELQRLDGALVFSIPRSAPRTLALKPNLGSKFYSFHDSTSAELVECASVLLLRQSIQWQRPDFTGTMQAMKDQLFPLFVSPAASEGGRPEAIAPSVEYVGEIFLYAEIIRRLIAMKQMPIALAFAESLMNGFLTNRYTQFPELPASYRTDLELAEQMMGRRLYMQDVWSVFLALNFMLIMRPFAGVDPARYAQMERDARSAINEVSPDAYEAAERLLKSHHAMQDTVLGDKLPKFNHLFSRFLVPFEKAMRAESRSMVIDQAAAASVEVKEAADLFVRNETVGLHDPETRMLAASVYRGIQGFPDLDGFAGSFMEEVGRLAGTAGAVAEAEAMKRYQSSAEPFVDQLLDAFGKQIAARADGVFQLGFAVKYDPSLEGWIETYSRKIFEFRKQFGSRVRGDITVLLTDEEEKSAGDFLAKVGRYGTRPISISRPETGVAALMKFLEKNPKAFVYGLERTGIDAEQLLAFKDRAVDSEVSLYQTFPVALVLDLELAPFGQITPELLKRVPQILPGIQYVNHSLQILQSAIQLVYREYLVGQLIASAA